MSVRISTWVWQHSGAAGNDLLILLALADQADDNGLCWPSVAHLSRKTRLSRATLQRRLHALSIAGKLTIKSTDGRSNRYVIRYRAADLDELDLPQTATGEVPQSATGRNLTLVAPGEAGGASSTEAGGASPGEALTITTSVNRQSRAKFDEFWSMYPKKVGKKAAEKKWATLTRKTDSDEIIAGLRAQLPAMEAKDRQYVPNPETWLNKGRWEDEVAEAPRERGWWE